MENKITTSKPWSYKAILTIANPLLGWKYSLALFMQHKPTFNGLAQSLGLWTRFIGQEGDVLDPLPKGWDPQMVG